MKLKKVEIKGFRGIKNKLELNLNSKSCLIYGENGSGKSSITDAIEWFYHDKIDHLSGEEIDRRGGVTAIRNIHISDNEKASVSMFFSDSKVDNIKEIDVELRITNQNFSDFFTQYISNSKQENLILRYANLTELILATKKVRLDKISQIIGLEDVLKTRDTLKRTRNEIAQKIKTKRFDDEISKREGQILEKLGELIVDDTALIQKVNELIKDLNFPKIATTKDIDNLLNNFKSVDDSIVIRKRDYLEKSKNQLLSLKNGIEQFYEKYQNYCSNYNNLLNNIELIKQIALEKLWNIGVNIIQSRIWEEDKCPLCFQNKSKMELISEINERIKKLSSIKEIKNELENLKKELKSYLQDFMSLLSVIEKTEFYSNKDNILLQEFIGTFKNWWHDLEKEIEKDLFRSEQLKCPEDIKIDQNILDKTIKYCDEKYTELGLQLQGQKILEIQDRISLSWERYKEIQYFRKEKEILEKYLKSMTLIYNEFVKKQKEELDKFINQFSDKISEYYNYMHPGENISDFQVKLVEDNDDLKGLTIEYKFHNLNASPPQKYLSESHLNSLGIAFFLASVEAFNKENKFFVLDDIVSSFDSEHRKRLADIIIEKFKDYQVIILTHEKDWFELMKNLVRGNVNWYIQAIKWSAEDGTHLDESLIDLEYAIENKIKNNDPIGLGNLIRKYLEKILKEISQEIEVYVPYKGNDINEKRMCNEMLSCLKSKVNKQTSKSIFAEIIDKLLNNSLFIGNVDSHYNSFQASIGDCRAFWDDVKKLKNLFYCDECNKTVSVKYYDEVKKKLRCKCGKLKYDWTK